MAFTGIDGLGQTAKAAVADEEGRQNREKLAADMQARKESQQVAINTQGTQEDVPPGVARPETQAPAQPDVDMVEAGKTSVVTDTTQKSASESREDRTSETDQKTTSGMAEESRQKIEKARLSVAEAVIAKTEAESARATKEANKDKYVAEQTAIANNELAADKQRGFTESQQRLNTLKGNMDELANKKVDPNRYWQDKSTAGKLGVAFALMIGGMKQGVMGGENPGMRALERAIDADISAQEKEIDILKSAISNNQTLFNMAYELTNDRDIAKYESKIRGIQLVKDRMQALIDRESTPAELKANGQAQIAAMDMRVAELTAEQQSISESKTVGEAVTKSESKTETDTGQTSTKFVSLADKDPAKELTKAEKDTLLDKRKLSGKVGTLIDLWKKEKVDRYAPGVIDSAMLKTAKALGLSADKQDLELDFRSNELLFSFVKAMSGAQVSEGELGRYQAIIPRLKDDPENSLHVLTEFQKELDKEYKDYYDSYTTKLGLPDQLRPGTALKSDAELGIKK